MICDYPKKKFIIHQQQQQQHPTPNTQHSTVRTSKQPNKTNIHLITMNRCAEFNNCGVRLLNAGHIDESRDCFRAALEFRINYEAPLPEQQQGPTPRCVTPEIIFLAEHHLAHIDTYLQEHNQDQQRQQQQQRFQSFSPVTVTASCPIQVAVPGSITIPPASSSATSNNNNINNKSNHHIIETLFNPRGFFIEPDTAPLESAITVYNLALSHQVEDRSAWKARVFYELACVIMSLQGMQSEALNMAINNNLQVWSNDNRHNPHIIRANGTFYGTPAGTAILLCNRLTPLRIPRIDSFKVC